MGLGASKPKSVTRQQLLAATSQPREFVDRLFQVMIKNVTPKEILDLGNPAQCKQYIFVMADRIKEQFRSLKVQPTRDSKTGILQYRKKDDITSQTINYEACLTLAQFYVRIFQIFGALALTVVDDPGAGAVLTTLALQSVRPTAQQKKAAELGTLGAKAVPFQGGVLEEGQEGYRALEKYRYLRPQVSKSGSIYTFDNYADMTAAIEPAGLKINLKLAEESVTLRATLKTERLKEREGVAVATLSGFRIRIINRSASSQEETKINKVLDQIRAQSMEIKMEQDSAYVGQKPIDEKIYDKMNEVRRIVEAQPQTVENVRTEYQKLLKKAPETTVASRTGPGAVDVAQTEALKSQYIQEALAGLRQGRPISWCVARAIQLLSGDALTQIAPKVIATRVCLTKFDDASHGMIPNVGQDLRKSMGLHSMEQLQFTHTFTEQSASGTIQNKVEVAEGDKVEQVQFLQKLHDLLSADKPMPVQNPSLATLIQSPKPKCDTAKAAKPSLQITNPQAIKQILSTVNTLFAIQLSQSSQVVDFLKKNLVQISKEGIRIHPTLLTGGVEQLNKVAKAARALLLSYYTRCEQTQQIGAEIAAASGTAVL